MPECNLQNEYGRTALFVIFVNKIGKGKKLFLMLGKNLLKCRPAKEDYGRF